MSESESGSASARAGLLAFVLEGCVGPGLPILELGGGGGEQLSVVVFDGDMPEPWPELWDCGWSPADPRIHLEWGEFIRLQNHSSSLFK